MFIGGWHLSANHLTRAYQRPDVFYIPLHAVFHSSKVRVVFNASMPTLFKWVFHEINTFRQILIHSRGRDWLRILINFGDGLMHFRLCTVAYDTACALFQSLRVLRQLLLAHCPNNLRMSELFHELSYVDDFFGGADTSTKLCSFETSSSIYYRLLKLNWANGRTKQRIIKTSN